MAQKTRSELQDLFQTGAKPSQQDFADFIESTLNRRDDGIEKPSGANTPLKINAQGDDEKLLDFYNSDGDTKTWSISQKSGNNEGLNISNSSGDSQLFIDSNTGNVGIGTDTPGATLDVAGALKFSGTGTLIFHNTNESGTATGDGFRIKYGGNFFGTDKDALVIEKTDFNGDIPDGGIAFVNTGSTGTPQTALVIRGNGNVGIGTTAPSAPLQVTARNTTNNKPNDTGLYIFNPNNSADENATLCLRVAGSNGGNPFVSWDVSNVSGWSMGIDNGDEQKLKIAGYWGDLTQDTYMTFDTGGNVGIGTDTPAAKLSINGGLHIGGDSDPGDDNLLIEGTTTTNSLSVTSNSDIGGDLTVTGNVVIGTDEPEAQLHINGTTITNKLAINRVEEDDHDAETQKLKIYGGDLVFKVDNNENNQGIIFQNSGGSYTWRIYRTDVGENHADLKIDGGASDDVTSLNNAVTISDNRNVGIGKAPENGHKLEIYGGDLVFKVDDEDNDQDQGILFQNLGSYYTWRIYRTDAGNSEADLKIDGGKDPSITSLTNRMTITHDCNVGIGTDEPGAKLDINGTTTTNSLSVTGNSDISGNLDISGSLSFGASKRQMINLYDESYAIGVQTFTQYFRSSKHFAWYKGGSYDDGELNAGGGTVQMVIKNGNVGIGTNSPGAKLQIINELEAPGSSSNTFLLGNTGESHLKMGCHTNYSWIQSHNSKPLAINPIGNNVGIGTDSPDTKLEVAGPVMEKINIITNTENDWGDSIIKYFRDKLTGKPRGTMLKALEGNYARKFWIGYVGHNDIIYLHMLGSPEHEFEQ